MLRLKALPASMRRRRHVSMDQTLEQSSRAATGSSGLPDERGKAKIDHLVQGGFRLLLIFHH